MFATENSLYFTPGSFQLFQVYDKIIKFTGMQLKQPLCYLMVT